MYIFFSFSGSLHSVGQSEVSHILRYLLDYFIHPLNILVFYFHKDYIFAKQVKMDNPHNKTNKHNKRLSHKTQIQVCDKISDT